ncbi:MAG: tRNA uridine-5-carboxymethylaminomethyl(34) synthesis GTPase MnmE [Proteobacteria bacterium]|nr:tRNA uridine-5-carboxymethylaminomethyl(34) synthesis GTPase MnmE [Pseudomonadota bacterium]
MVETNDTIAAIATPPGRGGIGIIRISGAKAAVIAKQLVGKKPGEQDLKAREATFCTFLGEDGSPIDTGILIYYPQPASYTGEHVVELQGHGGRVVMSMLLDRVLSLGAKQARPGEFTERAFVNNKIDLVQAEAVAALIDSVSSQAARSAIRSLEGEFSKNINSLLQRLISLRTFVESALDFPEEEIDFIQEADIKEKLSACIKEIDTMLAQARQGAMLREGLKLAIIGSPNVGKSSLLNRLAGREAAIVSTTPGTTRDIVEENILIEGAPLNLLDTAGLRDTKDDVEEEGIKRALYAANQADIILLITEYGQKTGREEQRLLETIPKNVKTIVVRNKVDLADNKNELLDKNKHSTEIFLSAKTGEGVDALVQQLKTIMGLNETSEDSYMARTRHLNALLRTQEFLTKGVQSTEDKISLELLAEDLRMAQESLGTITGNFVADDLLGEIFSSFCIGK